MTALQVADEGKTSERTELQPRVI